MPEFCQLKMSQAKTRVSMFVQLLTKMERRTLKVPGLFKVYKF